MANSLKKLMQEVAFDKINVAQICDGCDMNRKSFYYHFKDKYDLVNWIFDSEITEFVLQGEKIGDYNMRWIFFESVCDYFYKNRSFYRKLLKMEGQNSFVEHFREFCFPLLRERLILIGGEHYIDNFAINFFTDAIICALERWLMEKDCMSPDEFVGKLRNMVQDGAVFIAKGMREV